jgi:RNA polymerase sigma-70 factor (ECF subfamily)
MKERSLLQDIKHGDRGAMKMLYCRYSDYAMAVGMRYVADKDTVRDVLQESFIKVYTSIDNFEYRGEGSLKAWIMRIVANESLNYLRKNDKLTFVDDIPDTPTSDEPDVGDIPEGVLMDMIERLPHGYRTVLNLYVFEEKSHKEIAEMLNIKESSSASQFLRAKKLLAKMIKEYKDEQ